MSGQLRPALQISSPSAQKKRTVALQPTALRAASRSTLAAPPGARLHVGCGARRLAGWINADAVSGVGDAVIDLHDDGCLPAASFETIYGCHVLEHCWPQDTPAILHRLFDALQPGGTLRLSVPDLRLVVKNCVESHQYGDERSALSVLYGGDFSRATQGVDLHRQAFWKERLERLLHEAGFVRIREWGLGQYAEIDALGDYATRPRGADGKSLISLNLEANRPGQLQPPPGSRKALDLSVLLGTVERFEMLKQCIEAVRKSLAGSGYTHEIVVAYGHVQDPALSWMKGQSDIVPVLGGVQGAIEAFNLAYAACRGRLICQINDDVLVDEGSIPLAIRHLDTSPDCAGVVFKFDRGDGLGYRSESVAGALHPNQMVARRETCEAVVERLGGFWGDATHRTDKTYGGDSAFGVVCRYLGLVLSNVEGVRCRDCLTQDALRAKNGAAVAQDHGTRWRAMFGSYFDKVAGSTPSDEWPNLYLPRSGAPPRRSPIETGRPLRLLHASLQTPEEAQTAQRAAFARIGPTMDVSWWPLDAAKERQILDAARAHRPDVVFCQVQSACWTPTFAAALRQAVGPACTLTNWTGDVRTGPAEPVERWMVGLGQHFDLLLADNTTYPRKLKLEERVAADCGYLSCGVDPEINRFDPEAPERAEVVFLGTNYQALDRGARERLLLQVAQALPHALRIYGLGWQTSQVGGISGGFVQPREAAAIMRSAKVTLSTSLFNDLGRYTSDRLKRALCAGAVVALRRFPDLEGLGLQDGKNCLVWQSPEDLIEILRDWQRPERAPERRALRQAAAALGRARFCWDRVVEEWLAIVRDQRARRSLP